MDDDSEKSDNTAADMTQIKAKLREVDRQLLTLQWDKDHNQLNPGMETKYSKLKTEKEKLA